MRLSGAAGGHVAAVAGANQERPSLCVVSLAPLERDARVLRQVDLGSRLGYRVTVVAWGQLDYERPGVTLAPVQPVRAGRPSRVVRAALVLAGRLRTSLWPRWYWSKPDHQQALAAVQAARPDIIHANEAIALPLAVRAATATGARLLFDAHEFTLDQRKGRRLERSLAAPMYRWLLRTYAPRAHAMITVSPRIARAYEDELGVACGVVRNAPAYRPTTFRPTDPAAIRIVHHGVAMRARRLEDALALVAALDPRYSLRLLLVPSSPGYLEELRSAASRLAPGRVEFREPVAPEDVVAAIADCDVGLAVVPPVDESYRLALPNKFFDYLAAGLAPLIGPSPEMADICREFSCGLIADDFSPASAARLLRGIGAEAIDDRKRGALRAAAIYNAGHEMGHLAALYEHLLAGDRPEQAPS
jgi:hypothetical protein